jgi:acetylornithine deacetylase
VVGEPTLLDLAIAEKGLMVLDCISYGRSGHAAREEGDNAIYKAMLDMEWFRTFSFPKRSESLGPVKMTVTIVQAGQQHNVIPAICNFTVDVRTTDAYSNEETLQIIREHVKCEIHPQAGWLRPSSIPVEHPFVQAGIKLGRKTYVSPTTSDQAMIPCTSLKVGPGDSARSHIADEFIYLSEIEQGIALYVNMLSALLVEQETASGA